MDCEGDRLWTDTAGQHEWGHTLLPYLSPPLAMMPRTVLGNGDS